jgi:2-keto-3-deoxy-L-rhamnonate aldolase RhmA
MTQARDIRRRLYAGERVCGTMAFEFFTPGLIPLLHGAGCDWVILDTEHSGVGIETIKHQIAYARGLDIAVWVRVPEIRYAAIAPMLDAGAQGIMVPMLETVAQAQELVAAARYRPEGARGCAFGVAHDGYRIGDAAAVIREANERIVLIGLIESRNGIENCEAIMATPGLDVGWLGHFDLSNDMGITGQFEDPGVGRGGRAPRARLRRYGQDGRDRGREPRLPAPTDRARLSPARLRGGRLGDAQRLYRGYFGAASLGLSRTCGIVLPQERACQDGGPVLKPLRRNRRQPAALGQWACAGWWGGEFEHLAEPRPRGAEAEFGQIYPRVHGTPSRRDLRFDGRRSLRRITHSRDGRR